MPQVSKGYTFTNGTTADATQVNADLDTLFNLVNGGMDTTNFLPKGIGTDAIADGAVTPAKTEGLPYASDLFGSSFVVSGLTVTKYSANVISVSAGTAYMKQADTTVRQESITTTTLTTTSPSATYYLDLNPDGTWSFTTGHSSVSGYLNIATVTTDSSGNVNVITQNTAAYNVTLLGNATGTVTTPGGATQQYVDSNYAPTSAFVNSKAASGYQKLQGGLIIQWGTKSVAGTPSATNVAFPIAFPTACVSVVATVVSSTLYSAGVYSISATSCNLIQSSSSAQNVNWTAIGY